ncbi:GntR family transcriptional regulator [Streptomyces solincola]|uniref:GntR family transcriptional regulator n=1 Tax=Streptomyces solincola TaxID=2100817 RepID=A0A2S9PUN4_9ACTN|nr:GntR family transcriptional regulator [Streptomyces solincola]PRH78140.1 GntR family transcriptional regulator [Streptomyces solincola]
MAESPASMPLPLYLRVAAALRDDLTHRRIAPGTRLPSERSLVERFRVNRQTVRSALHLLREEGLVVTEKRGTFAAPAAARGAAGKVLAPAADFPCGPATAYPEASTGVCWEPAPVEPARRLGLVAGEHSLVHRYRVTGARGAVLQEAVTRFSRHALVEVPELARLRRPADRSADPDLRPLYRWMHRAGLRLTRRESVGVAGGPAAAGRTPAYLSVHREVRDQHGHLLELTDLRFAPEHAGLTYEFTG